MSRREGSVRLRHMLDHGREAIAIAAGKSRADLDKDRTPNLVLVRLLEIVGEAAGEIDGRGAPPLPEHTVGANYRTA